MHETKRLPRLLAIDLVHPSIDTYMHTTKTPIDHFINGRVVANTSAQTHKE